MAANAVGLRDTLARLAALPTPADLARRLCAGIALPTLQRAAANAIGVGASTAVRADGLIGLDGQSGLGALGLLGRELVSHDDHGRNVRGRSTVGTPERSRLDAADGALGTRLGASHLV